MSVAIADAKRQAMSAFKATAEMSRSGPQNPEYRQHSDDPAEVAAWKAEQDAKIVDFEKPPCLSGQTETWFHAFQLAAWWCTAAIVAVCAGWQSGKTVFLVPWLIREIQRRGPGDYGAFSTTYKLLERKFLPQLRAGLRDLCEYRESAKQFVVTDRGARMLWGSKWDGSPTVIQLGATENPESIESATFLAVVWDEPGQRAVPEQSFLTAQSRLMANLGRMCLASRPYESGWYEALVKAAIKDPSEDCRVFNFPSWANPINPGEFSDYFNKIRAKLPPWKFMILYEGKFTQPLGLIYDCFDYERDTCDDFEIPADWNQYPGLDFGPVNVAGLVIAENPLTRELFGISEYHVGRKMTVKEHVQEIKKGRHLSVGAGGSHTESGWREASSAAGLPLDEPPENDVEVQIQCVYEQLATRKIKFFRRACARTIGQIQLYSREVNDEGVVTDKIANKAAWHLMDALRYIITKLRPPIAMGAPPGIAAPKVAPPHVGYVVR